MFERGRCTQAGQQPYLEPLESALLHSRAVQRGDTGFTLGRKELQLQGRDMVHAIADEEADPAKRQRLEQAQCSRTWLSGDKKRAGSLMDKQAKFEKVSGIDSKRANACDMNLTDAMFDNIETLYADHYARGILATARPLACQVRKYCLAFFAVVGMMQGWGGGGNLPGAS
jgi:hypothetical protein